MICGGFSKASCKTSPLNELWIEQPWHDSEKFSCQSIQSQINLYICGRKYHCISSLFTFFLPFTTYDRLHAVVRVSPPRDLWMHMHFILQSTQLQHELHNHTYGSSRRRNHYPTSCYIKFLAIWYLITWLVSKVFSSII